LIGAGIIGIFYNSQDMLVYHPNEPSESKFYIEQPSIYNLPFEVVDLVTSDSVHLHSYFIKQSDENLAAQLPTVLFFHGNAGNIGHRLIIAHYMYTYCACNIFLVDYRGYGMSEGVPSEKGFYLDAECALNHLLNRNDIDKTKIIAFGQSIGGAVVIDVVIIFCFFYIYFDWKD
jgi:pimeloyl-ACP methyl ester carboxylesterase